jgi:hypothetical protein
MKPAQIIDAIYMVSMRMAKKHGINTPYSMPQCLFSQISRSINQDGMFIIADKKRRTSTNIPRVIRSADRAAATYHWHSGGCTAPQNSDFHTGLLSHKFT